MDFTNEALQEVDKLVEEFREKLIQECRETAKYNCYEITLDTGSLIELTPRKPKVTKKIVEQSYRDLIYDVAMDLFDFDIC